MFSIKKTVFSALGVQGLYFTIIYQNIDCYKDTVPQSLTSAQLVLVWKVETRVLLNIVVDSVIFIKYLSSVQKGEKLYSEYFWVFSLCNVFVHF